MGRRGSKLRTWKSSLSNHQHILALVNSVIEAMKKPLNTGINNIVKNPDYFKGSEFAQLFSVLIFFSFVL